MIIDFDKRNGGGSGSGYTLPVASSSVLGGIKVGQNMQIDSAGTLTANIDLSDYATQDELSGYVETSAMSGYATTDSLSAYTPSSAMSDYLTVSDYRDDVDDVLENGTKSLYADDPVGLVVRYNDGIDKAKVFKVTSGGTSVDDYTYVQPSRNTKSPQPEGWVVGKSEQIATIDPSTFSQPAIVIGGTVSKFGYMDGDVAHFLVVHGDGIFDEWYDKTEDPKTGEITWNIRGLEPIGGGDADAWGINVTDNEQFYMSEYFAEGVNCVFTDARSGAVCGDGENSGFQQDGLDVKYNASGEFSLDFNLDSIGEEQYEILIIFTHTVDNKLVYTDPKSDGSVEMEYGDDNIFFEDSQVALHVYYQEGLIRFYKSATSRVALAYVNAQITITNGYTTEYVGLSPYGVVSNRNDDKLFNPIDYKIVTVDGADHVNHVITTTLTEIYFVEDFNCNSILTLTINPIEKSIVVYKNDGSGEEISMDMPCDIDLTDYIPDMAIKASIYEGDGGVSTAQVVLVCHNNYDLYNTSETIEKVVEVPSKFFELIREAKTRFYSIISTDNGAFVYEGKDNLTVKNGIEVVDQLPFIGVENKIYMLDNEYQSVSYQPSVAVDSDGIYLGINQVHDLSELYGNTGIGRDDEGMYYAVGDNGISFAISERDGGMYQDNQALAVVRIQGDAPEYKVKTFPAFMVSLANNPNNNNEPSYKVAWDFDFLGTPYSGELYLPISGNTTSYVSGSDFDLSGITENTVTIATVNGDGSYFNLAIDGTRMYVTNGEYVCKDDFAEVGANEMSLYKYKGGRYYQVNGGDEIVTGTGVVVEESFDSSL